MLIDASDLGGAYPYAYQTYAAWNDLDPSGGWHVRIPGMFSVLTLGCSYLFIVIGWYRHSCQVHFGSPH